FQAILSYSPGRCKLRDAANEFLIMSGHCRAHTPGSRFVPQQLLGQRKVVLIDILLTRESHLRRLVVGALDEANRSSEWNQGCQVLSCAEEVCLQTDANIRVCQLGATIQCQRRIDVVACLHVNPDDTSRSRVFDDPRKILVAELWVEVQTKLMQLHRHFRLQSLGTNT